MNSGRKANSSVAVQPMTASVICRGGCHRRLAPRVAGAQEALDVLGDDNRVVDQEAERQHETGN